MGSGPAIAVETGIRVLRKIGHATAEFLYPPTCPLCGVANRSAFQPVRPEFCPLCRDELAPRIEYSCIRCAAPVGPHLDTVNGCIHCRKDRFAFEGVIRLGVYEQRLREVCLRAKKAGAQPLAAALAHLLFERERRELDAAQVALVVPVPQHWTRRLSRAHHSAETLGHALARCLKVPYCGHILAKVRMTPAQSGLSPRERRANLRGAFQVRSGAELSGKCILLVDDILTTGTTAHEASKALRRADAERVVVAVVARGLGQSDRF